MYIVYGIYKLGIGEITQVGTCLPANYNLQTPTNNALGLVELPLHSWDYYVDTAATPHEVKPKTAYPLTINKTAIVADGVDQIIITNLLNPTKVTWPDGEETIETDGEARFSLDLAGEYTVTLEAVPYLTEVINVTATNPA